MNWSQPLVAAKALSEELWPSDSGFGPFAFL
jgi:hypothetical protein